MLPQYLCIDAGINRESGEPVLFEINGEEGGYVGLRDLGEDPSPQIRDVIFESLSEKRVIVNSNLLLSITWFSMAGHKRLLVTPHDTEIVTPPFRLVRPPNLTVAEFESRSNLRLCDFDAHIGLNSSITDLQDRLEGVNMSALELLARNKWLQYQVLGDVAPIPESRLVTPSQDDPCLDNSIYLAKPLDGNHGSGIVVVTSENIDDLNILKQGSYLLQKFVETQPVENQLSRELHYGRARVVWCGGYRGGYWALSRRPIKDGGNPIVNYHTSGLIKRFTDLDHEKFSLFLNKTVPKILDRSCQYGEKLYGPK